MTSANGQEDGFNIELDNDLGEIARLGELVEAFGERHCLPEMLVFQVNLAFDELITNIVSYGFPQGGGHKIGTALRLDGDRLVAEVTDDGIPFNPLDQPPPDLTRSLSDRSVGGLGIHFVRTMMDEVTYRRTGGRNCLIMTKTIPAAAP